MSSREYSEWIGYAQQEPFGDDRADLRMAVQSVFLANVIVSTWTGKKGPFDNDTITALYDSMPRFENAKEPISKEEAIAAIDAAMMALVHATGGKDLRETS